MNKKNGVDFVIASCYGAEKIDFTRKAGLPQMVLLGDLAVLSWTGGGESDKQIIVTTAEIVSTQQLQ